MARSRSFGKNAVKRGLRRAHPAMVIIPALFLLFGLLLGYFAVGFLSGADDGLTLRGESEITVPLGADYTYREEGYSLRCLFFDATDAVTVGGNMTKNADGSYTLDTTAPGTYYITYTSEHPLFYSGVRRVRSFTVVGGEA